jgi:hypothetical protein
VAMVVAPFVRHAGGVDPHYPALLQPETERVARPGRRSDPCQLSRI